MARAYASRSTVILQNVFEYNYVEMRWADHVVKTRTKLVYININIAFGVGCYCLLYTYCFLITSQVTFEVDTFQKEGRCFRNFTVSGIPDVHLDSTDH